MTCSPKIFPIWTVKKKKSLPTPDLENKRAEDNFRQNKRVLVIEKWFADSVT